MKYEIIYTEHYALIVSDEKPDGFYYDTYLKDLRHTGGSEYGESSITKKIIAHRPLTDAPILEGVPLLPEFSKEDDVEDLKGDSTKLRTTTGWNPKYTFETLLDEMIEYWMNEL
jgi:nucleoside-diphosphate-sugar epimerase